MGQKINPNGFRLGVIRDWESKWYADKGYKETLNEDLQIRKFISEKLKDASVSTVEIERQLTESTFQFILLSQVW